jgi:type II secretory pathway pseudopilin PulG
MVSGTQRDAGFAIVEVLLAVVVVTVLAVGVFGSEQRGFAAARAGIAETAAAGLLQERLDALRADPAALAVGTASSTAPAELRLLPDARLDESVELLEPGLLEARVRLSWLPDGARARTERIVTTWIAREDGR